VSCEEGRYFDAEEGRYQEALGWYLAMAASMTSWKGK
jgi:hypothetical protein